jgi:S1-C subfamily serine protease
MPIARRSVHFVAGFMLAAAAIAGSQSICAEPITLEQLLSGILRIKTTIDPDGRTGKNLGHEREGTGIVIDGNGLILTIGYLMVEVQSAEVTTGDGHTLPAAVVGYDYETGFGLLRALTPLKSRPVAFGKSAEVKEQDRELVVSYGGADMVTPVHVVSERAYAGSWEYLLDQAIFTAPPHPRWSGAALVNRDGKLVGVGSLIVRDATGNADGVPGNMFVPIDRLPPILEALVANGRPAGPGRPWLGVNTEEAHGRLVISSVTPDGPAQKAGLHRGDIILGVGGKTPDTLAEFYREVWAEGDAGIDVPLDVLQGGEKRRIDVKSMNRLDHLKLKSSY